MAIGCSSPVSGFAKYSSWIDFEATYYKFFGTHVFPIVWVIK